MARAFVSGYSGTPLEKKLGIRESFRIRLINAPKKYFELFTDWPHNIQIIEDAGVKKNFIHFFTKDEAEFYFLLPVLKSEIEMNGMIWVSWPKKTSKMSSGISENIIRNYALEIGLVDIKVCSVNDKWSALKLVIPLKLRKQKI
jgi:hypothetical protein